jgi:hypothetical protein
MPSRSFLQYWKFTQAEYDISLNSPLKHSGSAQFNRVHPGDTVWLASVASDGQLFLVGRILVNAIVAHSQAETLFQDEVIYPSSLHVIAEPGTEEMPRLVNLAAVAAELRFESSSGRSCLQIEDGRVNPQQLQTMRLLTTESAQLLTKSWETTESLPDAEIEALISRGAGFGTPENNRVVETKAVGFVTQDYLGRGWSVRSVEHEHCGYDLVCTKGSVREDVEVKGISGALPSFIITRGEVRHAQNNPQFVLCAVTNARGKNPKLWRYSGPEFLVEYQLEALAFKASKSS